ncbi:MAG: C40 family peptidase [Alicyclobacillus sp.]|nr:C40 family peptidase [Alicyclobacillus sp.]
MTTNHKWTSLRASGTTRSGFHLPPGVSYDASVHPLATPSATRQAKVNAVLKVAKSKLGTPYIWGHNEDRGQYGFDCSNYTAYVYHHALGYRMSGASRTQASSVGWRVPISQMQPGDLLIFDNGGHVGIYVGDGRMIQEGGGLGKVGYLSVKPGSYWRKHLTAVKRMF